MKSSRLIWIPAYIFSALAGALLALLIASQFMAPAFSQDDVDDGELIELDEEGGEVVPEDTGAPPVGEVPPGDSPPEEIGEPTEALPGDLPPGPKKSPVNPVPPPPPPPSSALPGSGTPPPVDVPPPPPTEDPLAPPPLGADLPVDFPGNSPPPLDAGRFIYNGAGRRDPFQPYAVLPSTSTSGDPVEKVIELKPLQRFDLSQLKVVGVIWNVNRPKVMILDPTGQVHVVYKNERIGRNNGYIAVVREGEIVVVESYETGTEVTYNTRILSVVE